MTSRRQSIDFVILAAERLELVVRCLSLVKRYGQDAAKSHIFYDVDAVRIDAWRWDDDLMSLRLSLRWKGVTVFSVDAQPLINAEDIEREHWPDGFAVEALHKLREIMLLDDLASV